MLQLSMRLLFAGFLLFFASMFVASTSEAQSRDTTVTGQLRPRWGSYLIQPFPSPAKSGSTISIQFYNHNDEVLTCKLFDLACREVMVLQPKQLTPGGLHTFSIPAFRLSTGCYFVRLITYTQSGAEDVIDNIRFLVVK